MIHKLIVNGLNGNNTSIEMSFNEDINLFTGKNGCGKTTILKILWYIQSGHIENLLTEVVFKSIQCTFTDGLDESYDIVISKDHDVFTIKGLNRKPVTINMKEIIHMGLNRRMVFSTLLDDIPPYNRNTTSIFFPTFRRIEGGFGIESLRRFDSNIMNEISERLSTSNHHFVASISTEDVSNLVNAEYAKRSESINKQQQDRYKEIENLIKKGLSNNNDKLLEYVTEGEKLRTDLLKPFSVLKELTESIFKDKGILLRNLTLGDANHAIDSDKLSSGEKQMLSFLCYNTFIEKSCVFIDEPELSLHPDWQRRLISTLVNQGNNNQYFISTHSPFIYSKYPDKEIILDEDKGGNQ